MHWLAISHNESSVDGHELFQNAIFLATLTVRTQQIRLDCTGSQYQKPRALPIALYRGLQVLRKTLSVASFVVVLAVLLWIPVSRDVVSLGDFRLLERKT